MKEIDKMKSGLEYCFDDEEVIDMIDSIGY